VEKEKPKKLNQKVGSAAKDERGRICCNHQKSVGGREVKDIGEKRGVLEPMGMGETPAGSGREWCARNDLQRKERCLMKEGVVR